jgi:hypothetical protein
MRWPASGGVWRPLQGVRAGGVRHVTESPPPRRSGGSYGRHLPSAGFPARVLPATRVAAVDLVPGSGRACHDAGGPRVRGAPAPRGTAPPAPGDPHGGGLARVAAAHAPRRVLGSGGRLDLPAALSVLPRGAPPSKRCKDRGAPCARAMSLPGRPEACGPGPRDASSSRALVRVLAIVRTPGSHGSKRGHARAVPQERTGQTTRRSCAFSSPTLPRSPPCF